MKSQKLFRTQSVRKLHQKIDNSSWFANQPDEDCLCCFERVEWYMWDVSKVNADNIACPSSNVHDLETIIKTPQVMISLKIPQLHMYPIIR